MSTETLTGTVALVRLILRRNRVWILVWVISIALLVFLTAVGVESLLPTQASIDQAALASQGNAGMIAFNGPAQGLDSLGGQVAFQVGAGGMVIIALMSAFTVGRLTRGEEEAGRLELVRSLPVGVHAPTVAALLTVTAMNVAVAALSSVALVAEGLPLAGSLVLGVSFGAVGLFFAGAALVAAQITENTRVVYGSGVALVILAYLIRAVGDVGDGTVSWFSPIGMAQKARPYADERSWPLALLLVVAVALVVLASRLAVRRDHGAGLVAPRPGPAAAAPSLGHPLGLAMRLQQGTLIAWAGGVLVVGIAYGWIAPAIDSFVADNPSLAQLMASAGSGSLTDSYFATSLRVMALMGSGFAIQAALRLRSEESAMRAEPVLATPLSRWRWAASHLVIALGGSVALLAVAGLATGVSYAVAGGPWSSVPRLLAAALVNAPAMWLMIGLAMIVFGFVPRLVDAAWAVLAVFFVFALLGGVLRLPDWVLQLSPFDHTPPLPAASLDVLPLAVVTIFAAVLILAGLGGFRRRDIG
ncbi:MAG: ABC transporter permease [Candidatus Limnocylindrales bacterium]